MTEGLPPRPRSSDPVVIRLPPQMLAKIDAAIEHGTSLTRSEEIRRLLARAMQEESR